MTPWFKNPSLMGMLLAGIRICLIVCIVSLFLLILLWVNPTPDPKLHSGILMGLGALFFFQEGFISQLNKNVEDARKIGGLKSTQLQEHFAAIWRVKEQSEKLWWGMTILRLISIVSGSCLNFNLAPFTHLVAFIVGYTSTFVGIAVWIQVYSLNQSVHKYLVDQDNKNRIAEARAKSADALRLSLQKGWNDNLNRDGYPKVSLTIKC